VGELVVFFVRDPIARFVSGFNSRKRQGQPRFNLPWSKAEQCAFSRFASANELAEALCASDTQTREAAVTAMQSIDHIKSSYWDWFDNEEYFLSRLPDVLFIGLQSELATGFDELRQILGLPDSVSLPRGDVRAHRTPPGFDSHLDGNSRINLKKWYARDFAFVALCRKLREQVNSRAANPDRLSWKH
jgi:hypothetical protein